MRIYVSFVYAFFLLRLLQHHLNIFIECCVATIVVVVVAIVVTCAIIN